MDKKLTVASLKKRNLSFIIDDLIISFIIIAIFYEFFASIEYTSTSDYFTQSLIFLSSKFLIISSLKIIYHTLFIWYGGVTLGKLLLKIKVIEIKTGLKPTFLISLYRAILRVISEMFFYLGFIYSYFNVLNQTLHDKITNIIIVDNES